MAKNQNVVDQVIDMMEKIEKNRRSAIKELLALRSKVEEQLAKLGYTATDTPSTPAVIKRGRPAVAAAPGPKRVFSAATRKKMLKAQQERRKREQLAKLESEKKPKKAKAIKKRTAKGTPAVIEAEAAKKE
jgi:hypothetical protein